MPNTRQAEKALRQSKKRALRNLALRGAYKKAVKGVKAAHLASQETKALLSLAQKKLDKAAKRGVIGKKTAARKLSRLARSIRKTVAQAA